MKFRLQKPESAFSVGNLRWTNKDLDPVPPHQRKWSALSFVCYWASDAFSASQWQFTSSVLAVGLSWREALTVIAVGYLILSFVISFNGATGVLYHTSFPVLSRASWGFWGSYIAIISRVILALFWCSITTTIGANATFVMISAIWPSFTSLPNTIPANQGYATNNMIAFLAFWIFQIPFLCINPNRVRWLFVAKSIILPITFITILIWAFRAAPGAPDSIFNLQPIPSKLPRSWAYLSCMTSVIGGYATLAVNQADFSRYSRVSPWWQVLYVPLLPIVFTFVSFTGFAASSAGVAIYGGEIQWNPMTLLLQWDNRAAQFFVAFAFALASLGTNISANTLSAANDLMALFPSFINIRRGQLLCAILTWALVPWKILSSAGSFLNFISAYAVFLGPIAAIMLFDFWVVHRAKYDVLALYDYDGKYSYNSWRVNWRACVAFVVGMAPSLPGLINSVNKEIDPGVGTHPYQFGWLLGVVATTILYIPLSLIFPAKETFIDKALRPDEVYGGEGITIGTTPSDEEASSASREKSLKE